MTMNAALQGAAKTAESRLMRARPEPCTISRKLRKEEAEEMEGVVAGSRNYELLDAMAATALQCMRGYREPS